MAAISPSHPITEIEEDASSAAEKIKKVAQLYRESKNIVFFTGAGISTSAQIPDFRGPNGCWTAQAQGRPMPKSIRLGSAVPTVCHMGILNLIRQPGKVGHCVSQNIDGLHRRSGLTADEVSELHGNSFAELCWKCGKEYFRSFEIRNVSPRSDCAECKKKVRHFCHCTPRQCECGSVLKDSIIHFKETLPLKAVTTAFASAESADMCIALGSSLTVSPANQIPEIVAKKGKSLVIVNLQATPLDSLCAVRIFMKTDEFMVRLQEELGLAPVEYVPEVDHLHHPEVLEEGTPCGSTAISMGMAAALPGGEEVDEGGWVQPNPDCPHATHHLVSPSLLTVDKALALLSQGCSDCDETKELWLCLTCLKPHCGRYINGHALAHSETHKVAISLADLNTWCYLCQEYIVHDAVDPFHLTIYYAKFGQLPVGATLKSTLPSPE